MYSLSAAGLFSLGIARTVLFAGGIELAEARQWADYYAAAYGVPKDLVGAVIEVESAWRPYAVSPKGAAGLMQLMPGTAAHLGVTNRFEIQQNLRAGVAYLSHLLTVFRGDVRLVVAGYFAGEHRIRSAGLAYSNAAVFRYVHRVVRLYEQKRQTRLQNCTVSEAVANGGNFP
ncbi:MAG: lytic transglycosylase domain-containing protein [Bryobacterales bacterium]|nr:lytic transglycosylase domain-containing protein [Bryobacterales bacterium]